jgi:RNase P/RNase MRP subunit POP5
MYKNKNISYNNKNIDILTLAGTTGTIKKILQYFKKIVKSY